MRLQLPEKQPTPSGPKQDSQTDSLGILAHTNWTKLLLVRSASSIMPDSVKSALYIRREAKKDAFLNSALFRFKKGLGLRHTTELGTARLSTCSFFSTGFRSFIYTFQL